MPVSCRALSALCIFYVTKSAFEVHSISTVTVRLIGEVDLSMTGSVRPRITADTCAIKHCK